jgi:hypothetical protein
VRPAAGTAEITPDQRQVRPLAPLAHRFPPRVTLFNHRVTLFGRHVTLFGGQVTLRVTVPVTLPVENRRVTQVIG